jgi:hypothetical protein
LYRTALWQMVFGPAGALCMGSEKNFPRRVPVPGFADGSRTVHRTVTNQKSENLIEAAGALGQGAHEVRTRPVGAPAVAPDGKASAEIKPGKCSRQELGAPGVESPAMYSE